MPDTAPAVETTPLTATDPESRRLQDDADRKSNWKRWGPYLSERQWGTVREDYSDSGACWDYFPHDQSRSRTYRWGEDALLGWSDRQARICFGIALWNGVDPILKERLFGLGGPEGNHGEDVKELYYYLDSTPTHSYVKGLYKYSQLEFPYKKLVDSNRGRDKALPEFEITDTGVFDEGRYFDVQIEYAKPGEEDTLIRITVTNRGPDTAKCHVLPTVWFRNTWRWPDPYDGREGKPSLRHDNGRVAISYPGLGEYQFEVESAESWLFTENETNKKKLFNSDNDAPFVKDAFHRCICNGEADAVNPAKVGTKAAAVRVLELAPGASAVIKCRLRKQSASPAFAAAFDSSFARAIAEADEFYANVIPPEATLEDRAISRGAYAGMLWNKQFYYYVVDTWLDGDANTPKPPASREKGRNQDWRHVFIRDILSMPDKWEYPWFAAWDLAFHTITLAKVDPAFAKEQLLLLLREWYMHPNGQIPAYEFQFGDVNPPVHAWACWRVYKETGRNDRAFLERAFQKLMLNFTWWVNRKDVAGKHLFSGGFLGLDNIGVFDRSKPLPGGGSLTQADGTSWMAFYCLHMLSMAMELALDNPAYEDIASKFFEHFVAITDAMNALGGSGLWDEADGFYYDQLNMNGQVIPLKVRSMVGLIPLLAVSVLDDRIVDRLPGFKKRMQWFLTNLPDLGRHVTRMRDVGEEYAPGDGRYLLAVVPLHRLTRILSNMLDEAEFLSPYGLRSLSRVHLNKPFNQFGDEYLVRYDPADSTTGMFGGNSNWRGPIWFPLNVVLLQALERYYHFYGNGLLVPCPVGSGRARNLHEVAREVADRLVSIFRAGPDGRRPCHGSDQRYASDPHFRDLLLYHEYFDGDTGRGIGAMHQTGWTGLVANLIDDLATNETFMGVERTGKRPHSFPPPPTPTPRLSPPPTPQPARAVAPKSKPPTKPAPKPAAKSKPAPKPAPKAKPKLAKPKKRR
jgi:hypothetical protein